VATFGVSTLTDVSVVSNSAIGTISFAAGANPFTIRTIPGAEDVTLTISGTGITNNSGIAQNFVLEHANNHIGSIEFTGTATVGTLITITSKGFTSFTDHSSAGDGTYHCLGGSVLHSFGAGTFFNHRSTAGRATLTSDGGSVAGAGGGTIWFVGSSSGGEALITCNGGTVAGAGGGFINFGGRSSPRHATLIANGGSGGGGGGQIVFDYNVGSPSSQPRVQLHGNGLLSIDAAFGPITIGSLEGDGIVNLGDKELIIGSNDLSTSFSGTISGFGAGVALNKIGAGTLTVSGSNTYTGSTTVSEGALVVSNTTGSGTGTGPVTVTGGTLGGNGIISGAVTIGTGSGTAAFLEPSMGANRPATLTIQSALTFEADANYIFKINTRRAMGDQVTANGVTIEPGALFGFAPVANRRLTAGTVFTPISNTSPNPITGTFANLPDRSGVTIGRNRYHVSYEGGDGNDLTLTVVP
jgi:autotransporter-associated beta strand protein